MSRARWLVGLVVMSLCPAMVARPVSAQTVVAGRAGVAQVGPEVISEEELDAAVGNRLATLRAQEYAIRREVLQDLLATRLMALEAARRGVSVEQLTRQEIDTKIAVPTAEEVAAVYDAAKDRLGAMSQAEAHKAIASSMTQQRTSTREAEFVQGLRAGSNVRVWLEPPRTNVDDPRDAPAKGPANAPITIVEFSDFQCPFCARSSETMKALQAKYPTQVRRVFRNFPLPIHKDAIPAAVAARCANEQGRFWEMYEILFQNQKDLTSPALTRYATQAGLESSAFSACLSSPNHTAAMDKDLAAGKDYGVGGTPAFFINGRFLSGALPLEAFTQVIEEELQFTQQGSASAKR